jgi:predicted amidohydrolase
MQVHALDHHVWFIVCRNNGEWGMIVRPDGEVVAELTTKEGVAVAEVDLGFRHPSYIGSDFANRMWGERRPHLYGELARGL